VRTVTDQASRDGVTGTPTVLVDGTALADLTAAGLAAAVTAAQG
jgi:protein-disulfide isomerase